MRTLKLIMGVSVVGLCVGFAAIPQQWLKNTPAVSFVHSSIIQIAHGNLNGQHHSPDVQFNLATVEPGDILVCHNANGAYGYWTHSVIYVGHEQFVDADDFSKGTILQHARHYQHYDEVAVLRPRVSSQLRHAAAQVARSKIGTPYDPLGSLTDPHSEYCSKLIWEAYREVGIELCQAHGWVLPDEIASSPLLVRISNWRSQALFGGDTTP